ncbi:MAG: carboxypeptidase-like regulatory domain-containing protein [Acidimicrobiales bacterium]
MTAVKYLLALCLVAAGWTAWLRRDEVRSAFEWDHSQPAGAEVLDVTHVTLRDLPPAPDSSLVVALPDDLRDRPLPTTANEPEPVRIPMSGGASSLSGTVSSPSGPVGGAMVRIERLVGEAAARVDVVSDGDGRFHASGLPGGRFRVRAWRAPVFAQTTAEVLFLDDGGRESLLLHLEPATQLEVRPSARPGDFVIGGGATIAVSVRGQQVDSVGRIKFVPLVGVPVGLSVEGAVALTSSASAPTGADGLAYFRVRCNAIGATGATVTYQPPPSVPVTTAAGEPGLAPAPAPPAERITSWDPPDCTPPPTTTTAPPPPAAAPANPTPTTGGR